MVADVGRIAEHAFADGKCLHCEIDETAPEKRSCVFRDAPPRAVPVSVFADLGIIGDRMREIMNEERQSLSNVDTPPPQMQDAIGHVYFVERRVDEPGVVESQEEFELRRIGVFNESRQSMGCET